MDRLGVELLENTTHERRREPRIPVAVDALVHFRGGRSWVCTIRNFCAGGMFVQGDPGDLRSALDHTEGLGPLEIHFSVPGTRGGATHHLTGIAVRRVENALGIHFPEGMVVSALQALTAHSQAHPEGGNSPNPDRLRGESGEPLIDSDTARKLSAACAKLAEVPLHDLADEFFAQFGSELRDCESRASSISEVNRYLFACRCLENHVSKVRSEFVGRIVRSLERLELPSSAAATEAVSSNVRAEPRPQEKEPHHSSNTHLALVGKADFEQWLVATETVTAIERQLEQQIFILRTWLGFLQPGWSNKDSNPVCPAAIVDSLKQAMQPLELSHEVIKIAFNCFGRVAQSRLRALYETLISNLEASRLFPAIQSLVSTPLRRPGDSRVVSVGPGPNLSGRTGRPTGAGDEPAHEADFGDEEIREGLDRIFRLLGQSRAAADSFSNDQHILTSDVILKALGTLQRLEVDSDDLRVHGDLKSLLIDQLTSTEGPQARLPRETEVSLDMVDSLVRAVQEDEVLSKPLRQLVQRLELTLGKEAVRNGRLLSDNPRKQPALRILNQLEDVDVGVVRGDEKQAVAVDQVAAILDRLIADWDGNGNAFETASQQLTPLAERQKEVYRRNLDRVLRGCDGRSRLRSARREVLSRISGLLEGREVPESLLEIINPSWRNLLVNTALRHGTQSVEWSQWLQVIERLVTRLDPLSPDESSDAPGDGSAEVLSRCLMEGLSSIGAKPFAIVIDRLRAVLSGDVDQDTFVRVQPGQIAELFGWQDVDRGQDPTSPTGNDPDGLRWLASLRRVRALHPGSRVKFIESDASEQVAVLAWIDPAGDRFVFVNRRGLEYRDLHLREFTDLVNGGRARLLEEYDAPLLDRVSERMAHSAHSRIAAEAQQDELTSLVNRRGFERSLKRLLDASRNGDSSHCVLQVDLDGFGMVNSVLGTDGGDRLLREVALALTGIAEGHEAVIGRIGADQFGMLLYRTSVAEGLDVAERIVGAIRELEFAWQERECKVCATVAVLGTDSATESVGQILRNLDSSCRSGKQHGGDRACVYTEDSEEIRAQRAVLQVAAQVEAWLAAGRVQLTVQMIAPANRNSTLQGHYEILIAVADDAGVAGSPVRFIEAAERHGKMPVVDRYVVARALDWIGRHPQALEEVSGLSINLSGQSINHEGFLGYVLGEFEKSGAPPHKVCFEITETAAIGNMSRAIEFMQKLKVMGCRFALDDFGSGMSSYGYLRKLPVDYLKIDGSFVKNMVTDEGDRAVVRSINEIGHFFGKKTVAEYVHDDATRRLACELGIDYLQGWGIEKPKPIDSLLLPVLEAGSLVG